MHNGIISTYNPKNVKSKTNDTQNFILQYLAPIHKHYKSAYKMEKFRSGIRDITNSKFVFLDKNDRTYYVGDFVNEDGLKFSNSTYKNYTTYSTYSNCNYKYYSNLYDKYYDEKEDTNDVYYEYYDHSKNLIYLENSWFFWSDATNQYIRADEIDSELVYSLEDGSLYMIDDLEELLLISQTSRVYNQDFKLIV